MFKSGSRRPYLMKKIQFHKPDFSILSIAAANLVPLAGVLLFDWDVAVVILLYWAENIIIGCYNILKMAIVSVEHPILHLGKLFYIVFFSIHFGGFCAGHGFFILTFFNMESGINELLSTSWPGPFAFIQLLFSVIASVWQNHPPGMGWMVVFLSFSHGISFVENYLLKKEYSRLTAQELMGQPYKRVVIMHIAIIAGGIPIMMLGSPMPLLCILIFLKIGMDIYMHIRSHKAVVKEYTPAYGAKKDGAQKNVSKG